MPRLSIFPLLIHFFQISQPNLNPKDYYTSAKYPFSYVRYVKTIVTYLNESSSISDSDVEDIFNIEKSLSHVSFYEEIFIILMFDFLKFLFPNKRFK